MNGIYIELARMADEDRLRAYTADMHARRAAARLRTAAACCRSSLAGRMAAAVKPARSWLGRQRIVPACC